MSGTRHERGVIVHAELHGLAGRVDELREVVRGHAERLAQADGCLAAIASEPIGGQAGELLLDAWWRDERALQAHYATPEYAHYVQQVSDLLARPSDVTVHALDHSYRAAADLSSDPTRLG